MARIETLTIIKAALTTLFKRKETGTGGSCPSSARATSPCLHGQEFSCSAMHQLKEKDHVSAIRSGKIIRDLLFHLEALRLLSGASQGIFTIPFQLHQSKDWIEGIDQFFRPQAEGEPTNGPNVMVMLKSHLNPDDDFVEFTNENLDEIDIEDLEAGFLQVWWPENKGVVG